MKYKVKVKDTRIFCKRMQEMYQGYWGEVSVKVCKGNVVAVKQSGNGLNLVDVIANLLDEIGGEYV